MTKECAMNELSILDIDPRRHDVFSMLRDFVDLCHIAGVRRISLWHELKESGKDVSKPYHAMIQSGQRACKERDAWRRISRFFDAAESFEDSLLLEEIRSEGQMARGLGQALRLQGLALSVNSHEKWRVPFRQVDVHALDEGRYEETHRIENVRHAAERKNLDAHDEWQAFDEMDRLRIRLKNATVNHKPASEYGKHVNGTTDQQRRNNASGPKGKNQYFAVRNGAAVTDDVIANWEAAALAQVKEGGKCLVEYHGGNTFHVYCDLGENIGYEAPDGDMTSWIRVEWTSSGAVHSHPRSPRKITI